MLGGWVGGWVFAEVARAALGSGEPCESLGKPGMMRLPLFYVEGIQLRLVANPNPRTPRGDACAEPEDGTYCVFQQSFFRELLNWFE